MPEILYKYNNKIYRDYCFSRRSHKLDLITRTEHNQTGNVHVRRRNTGARSRNHCCSGKAISITYSECVSVALVTQRATRMRRIILPSVACLTHISLIIL